MSQSATVPAKTPIPQRSLKEAWHALLRDEPKMRIRDAADWLDVSEAELVATDCGNGITRLRSDWAGLLKVLPRLGRIMALTRNDSAVHERYGCFEQVEVSGRMGLVLGPDIDLRLFLAQWQHAFAATQDLASGKRHSLQFFDGAGTAVLKVYLTDDSDLAAYASLVNAWRADDQSTVVKISPVPPNDPAHPDDEVDIAGLRTAWEALRDTHDFFALLKQFRVSRTQALRLIGEDLARQVPVTALQQTLETAARCELPIMVFVGNRGCIQIHTGTVENIRRMGPWMNVLDADFNLHLREDEVDQAWIVRKPTTDGVVTSLELFDSAGETIALLFGRRKPGIPESPAWRALVAELPTLAPRP